MFEVPSRRKVRANTMTFRIEDLFVAYRKAKNEAYYDSNVAYGLKFAVFEENLLENLTRIMVELNTSDLARWSDPAVLGGLKSIPKRPIASPSTQEPWDLWEADPLRQLARNGTSTLLELRNIIDPSVDFQILSALWALHVGAHLEEELNSKAVYAYRLERQRQHPSTPVNFVSHRLFRLYLDQYKSWQEDCYSKIYTALERDIEVVSISLDIKNFYHEIHLDSLPELLRTHNADHEILTSALLSAIRTWNTYYEGKDYGLPVGLTASGMIANCLLAPLDSSLIDAADVFYGRYVDDFSIAFSKPAGLSTASDLLAWLCDRVEHLNIVTTPEGIPKAVINLPNHPQLEISHIKASIKLLHGEAGKEVLRILMDEQAARASEQRLKPPLPLEDPILLGRRALIVRDSANSQVHDLASVRSVELKRAAFGQLMRVLEQYDRDLDSESWLTIRDIFYGLVNRHCITPEGLFTYHKRLPWILALMVSCGDDQALTDFLNRLSQLRRLITPDSNDAYLRLWTHLKDLFYEAILGAANDHFLNYIPQWLSKVDDAFGISTEPIDIDLARRRLLLADWARKSYAEHWLEGTVPEPNGGEPPGGLISMTVETFAGFAALSRYDWRPIAFPTRALTATAITTRLPIDQLERVSEFLLAFRGTMGRLLPVAYQDVDRERVARIQVGSDGLLARGSNHDSAVVAVASLRTTFSEYEGSLREHPRTDLRRYNRVREIVTATLRTGGQVDYLVLPELSLPRRWADGVVGHLAESGVSLIAGLEYEVRGDRVRNQCLVALASPSSPGSSVLFSLDKRKPAWSERAHLEELETPIHFDSSSVKPLVINHYGFCFGVVICSDLTDIELRSSFRGEVDTLVILEWNPDIDGFQHIVASSATDLHAFIVQVNNREYGDSWIRGPFCEHHRRDILRIKGGQEDYVVSGRVPFRKLRAYQCDSQGVGCKEHLKRTGRTPQPLHSSLCRLALRFRTKGKFGHIDFEFKSRALLFCSAMLTSRQLSCPIHFPASGVFWLFSSVNLTGNFYGSTTSTTVRVVDDHGS